MSEATAPVAPPPPPPQFKLGNDEWREMLLELEMHHGVFYKLWEMGKPIFTAQLDTAAVTFNKGGDFVHFLFNPNFWQKCTHYERKFVICHEALHVILNHGVRMCDTQNRNASNVALDVVVNHMLTRCFGFDREQISNWDKLCWVDTVFKNPNRTLKTDKGKPILDDDCFEYYLNLLDKHGVPKVGKGKRGEGQPCQGKPSQGEAGEPGGPGEGEEGDGDGLQTLDDHEITGDDQNDWSSVVDQLDAGLNDEEKATIKESLDKHFQHAPQQRAGTATGGQWHIAQTKAVKKKQKWETVIKKWVKKRLTTKDDDQEQWARLNRRLVCLPRSMFLPSNMEIDEKVRDKHKIPVWFFLDTSGSCWHLKDRFFQAAMTIPEDRFDVKLFCFDTRVEPTDLKGKQMYGGGGTSFRCIETYIQAARQRATEAANQRYPDAVFVITDGYGDKVVPEFAERWYWFLDGVTNPKQFVPSYIPEESNCFLLTEFE